MMQTTNRTLDDTRQRAPLFRRSVYALLGLLSLFGFLPVGVGGEWIRPGLNTNQPVWGVRGGLLWALAPAGFRNREPRGLIRLGYPVLREGGYDLVNFIAVEPIVNGRRGLSELEQSHLDGVPGKRIWAESPGGSLTNDLVPGQLRHRSDGQEELQVGLRVEKFENGAHLRLVVLQRSDRPEEIQLGVYQEPDSAPLEYCILTATMGNMARTRRLWLREEVVSSLEVYRDYRGTGFAAHREYPLARLHQTAAGGVLVALTNNEENPATVYPFPNSELWHYAGCKVTQYWAKAAGEFRDDLQAVVNGRYTYWRSSRPIPGGVAFENFELCERFYDGQKSVFGITRRTPRDLGFNDEHQLEPRTLMH
ncbi:MAG TPA: hypothetical protein VMO17_18145 [Terriglobia bacterium]|nr:hypothetical protein [Terriglobia bacterium]